MVARSFVARTIRSRRSGPVAVVGRRQSRPSTDDDDNNNNNDVTNGGSTSSSSADQETSSTIRSARRELFNQLKYLQDPVRLADRVRILLRDGTTFDQAMELVRAASKNMPCTVSWNHLINYQMYAGKVKAALKTYNEVRESNRWTGSGLW